MKNPKKPLHARLKREPCSRPDYDSGLKRFPQALTPVCGRCGWTLGQHITSDGKKRRILELLHERVEKMKRLERKGKAPSAAMALRKTLAIVQAWWPGEDETWHNTKRSARG